MLTPCKMSSVTPREFLTENKNENAHLAKHKSREFFKYLNLHEAKLNFKSHFEFFSPKININIGAILIILGRENSKFDFVLISSTFFANCKSTKGRCFMD